MLNIRRTLVGAKWFLEAAILLAVARALVRFVPLRYWRKTLGPIDNQPIQITTGSANEVTTNKAVAVGLWVRRTAKKMPFRAVCLPQAMAGRWMLSRRGITNQIFIGAKRNEELSLSDFHAWLMHGDRCLTGQHQREKFHIFGKSQ
jgi:hypothetical protein